MREKKAATGFEPVNGGFADRSLNHLGTPPWAILSIPINVRADTDDTGDLSVLATDCNMPGCIPNAGQSMDHRASREQAVAVLGAMRHITRTHGRDGMGAAGQHA